VLLLDIRWRRASPATACLWFTLEELGPDRNRIEVMSNSHDRPGGAKGKN
jgi:hypothetical protein